METNLLSLAHGNLRKVHHIAFNVKNMDISRHFYGQILGLTELTGDAVPSTLKSLVEQAQRDMQSLQAETPN
jgi:glyoxylase I family protein